MKRFSILFIILLSTTFTFNQAVVSAPATDTILAQESASAKVRFLEQIARMKEQSTILKEGKDALFTVRQVIRNGRKAKRVAEKLKRTYTLLTTSIDIVNSSYTPSRLKGKPLDILETALMDVEMVSQDYTNTISNNVLRMDDYERLSQLDKLNVKLDEVNYRIDRTIRNLSRYTSLYRAYSQQ